MVELGHEVIAREIEVEDVAAVTARERPDVALVGLGESSQHALDLIDQIVREAACPVIVLFPPTELVTGIKRRLSHIIDPDVETGRARSTLCCDVRRIPRPRRPVWTPALIERTKGILMERHTIDEEHAYELMREHSH